MIISNTNTDLLKLIMHKKRVSQRELAQHLNISDSLLCHKIRGKSKFHDWQIAAIRDFMKLTQTEVSEIFYTAVILSDEGPTKVALLHELDMYIQLIIKGKVLAKSTLDEAMTGHIIQKFLSDWIRNPEQNVFTYALSEMDVHFKHKFFCLNDIIIQKIDTKSKIEKYARLFDSVAINILKQTITLTIDNKKIRSL
ncbi:MAG: hypothetical protein J6R32_06460 [Bacteroidales bacterium]|nr:hypothetical protein [Bacteroidales bacterium]